MTPIRSRPHAHVRPKGALALLLVAVLAATAAEPRATEVVQPRSSESVSFSDDFTRANGAVGNGWAALRGGWSIVDGAAVASGSSEQVLARPALFLADSFDVTTSLALPSPAPTARRWTGIAAQVKDHGDGTQSFYALRIGQSGTDGSRARWQLVRIGRSAPATEPSLLAEGDLAALPGTVLDLRLTAMSGGSAVRVRVAGAAEVERIVRLRVADRLSGGNVGLYSQSGGIGLRHFTVTATTGPGYRAFHDGFERADGSVGNGWHVARGAWNLRGGVAVPSGTEERLIYHPGTTLGSGFVLRGSLTLPKPALGYRSWAGLAFNVTDHGDGTQTYYVLRIGQSLGDGSQALWQVVRMTRSSSAASDALLAAGPIPAAPGTALTVEVESRNRGTGVHVTVRAEGAPSGRAAVERYVGLRFRDLLSGGRAGMYSQAGAVGLRSFGVETSLLPASPPADPGPLNCAPTAPGDYVLPGGNRTVAQVVDVGETWGGHPVEQSTLTTGSHQYVAYYDGDRRMTVARRALDSTTWTYRRLDSVLGWDSHNSVTMALDSTGHLHVSGNMHDVPLVYFRTTVAGDVSTLIRVPTMVSAERENSVTYPRFLQNTNGDLLFSYRNGGSGAGVNYYNRYDPATRSWSSLLSTPFIDGAERNAYPEGPVRGGDGFWHMAVMWRDTPDAGSSSMPSYLRSRDLVRWEDSTGRPIPLPATYHSVEGVDAVPTYSGAVNGNLKLGLDRDNRIVLTYLKYDSALGHQLFAARPNGPGDWQVIQLTNWTGRWEIGGGGSLPQFTAQLHGNPTTLPDGRLRIPYSCHGARRSLVVEPSSMAVVADVPEPPLPAEVTQVRSPFPGMQVRLAASQSGDRTYALRWESLPANQDQPRPPEQTPPPQPLRVYVLTATP